MGKLRQKIMKGAAGLGLLGALTFGGCAEVAKEMIKDSPIGWYQQAIEEIKRDTKKDQINVHNNRGKWEGYPLIFTTKRGDNTRIKEIFRRGEGFDINVQVRRIFPERMKYPLAIRVRHIASGITGKFDIFSEELINNPLYDLFYFSYETYKNTPTGEYEITLYGDNNWNGRWENSEKISSARYAVFR